MICLPIPASVSLLQGWLVPAAAVPAGLAAPSAFELERHEHQPPPWLLKGSCLLPQEKPYRQLGKPCQLGISGHCLKALGTACSLLGMGEGKPCRRHLRVWVQP